MVDHVFVSNLTLMTAIINLVLIFYYSWRTREKVVKIILNLHWRIWLLLTIVLLLAFAIRMFVYPHFFAMYLDDYYPLAIASKIINLDFHALNMPMFVAQSLVFIPFFIFGNSPASAFFATILIGVSTLFFFFLLSYLLTKNEWISLFAVVILSFHPTHIIYSLSSYNHMLIFLLLLLAFLYFFMDSHDSLFLSLLFVSFACFIRSEMVLLGAFFLIYRRRKIVWKPWLTFAVFLLLGLPQKIVQLLVWTAPSDTQSFSYANFFQNIVMNFSPLLIMIFLFSLLFVIKDRKMMRVFAPILILTIIHLSTNPELQGGGRYFLFTYSIMFLIIVQAAAKVLDRFIQVPWFAYLILILFLMGIGSYFTFLDAQIQKESPKTNELIFATKMPEYLEKIMPRECCVISVHPDRFTATTDLCAIYIEDFNYEGCVIFPDDISCHYPSPQNNILCTEFKNSNNLSIFAVLDTNTIEIPNKEVTFNATLYRLN